jgi:mannose-6-phosphate isomerase-like protein (cupin superfamily)
MAGYTIVNMNDLEDSAAGREGVEARFARKQIDSEHLGVSVFRYGPGHRNTLGHRHREQEEAYLVTGSGRIRLDDDILDLKRWDLVRIAPATLRALEAGPDGLEVVAIGSDRPEGGDGEAVEDWWTD